MPEQQTSQQAQAVETIELNDFEALLNKEFRPKTEEARSAVQQAVGTLATQALGKANLISEDVISTVESMIAELDKKLSAQLNLILHNAEFQKLESAWRGLHYLVSNTETDSHLKIRVMNISKDEVAKSIRKFKGAAWDQNPLFKKLYEDEFGSPGGEPFGALVADFYFSHQPKDVEILKGMGQICAASHCPMISAVDPALMNMDSWQELANPRDLTKIFQTPEYAAWRSLRQSDDSRYLALTMPRVLSRLPYGAKTTPVEGFAFEEETGAGDNSAYTWMNAAYAMGANINRAFKKYGWCASIRGVESGGAVEALPCHTFPTDDGGVSMKCPTEIAITDRREAELSQNGMLPLCHWKNTDYAVFLGGQTLNEPTVYDDADASSNARLSSRLPYIFATSRFSHFLKCIVRDKVGSFKSREDMQKWLSNWIAQYVTADPNAGEEIKARYPLAAADVVVEDVAGNPGYYSAKFYLRPHFQLEGLTASLRLVTKLPSEKK